MPAGDHRTREPGDRDDQFRLRSGKAEALSLTVTENGQASPTPVLNPLTATMTSQILRRRDRRAGDGYGPPGGSLHAVRVSRLGRA